jgi:hypothetical protein
MIPIYVVKQSTYGPEVLHSIWTTLAAANAYVRSHQGDYTVEAMYAMETTEEFEKRRTTADKNAALKN